jgi:hypothetical protein
MKNDIILLQDNILISNIDEILGSIFFKDIDNTKFPLDLNVGILGNTYLLTSIISIIFHRPNILCDFFENINYNLKGIYGIRMLIQGELNLILIDDRFPIINKKNKSMLLSYTKKEIWLPILEKAWAKANGKSFLKNLFGTPLEAFNTISFAPTFVYQHKKYNMVERSDLLWKKLLEASLKKYAICVSTEDGYECSNINDFDKFDEKDNNSYIQNNSNIPLDNEIQNSNNSQMNLNFNSNKNFSILNIYELEDVKLIKIWTPRNEDISEWNGLYSEDSDEWSKELKKYINYKKTPGVIYLTFEEYIKVFSWTYICKLEDNYLYRTLKSNTFSPSHDEDSEEENKISSFNLDKEVENCKIKINYLQFIFLNIYIADSGRQLMSNMQKINSIYRTKILENYNKDNKNLLNNNKVKYFCKI